MGVFEQIAVSTEDADKFKIEEIDGPFLESLKLHWKMPKHPWNIHAATTFADHMIQEFPEDLKDAPSIADYFIQRIETLRKRIVNHLCREGESSDKASQHTAGKIAKDCQRARVQK